MDQLNSSATNGPTEQNTVDYIERQLETYGSWNWKIGLSFWVLQEFAKVQNNANTVVWTGTRVLFVSEIREDVAKAEKSGMNVTFTHSLGHNNYLTQTTSTCTNEANRRLCYRLKLDQSQSIRQTGIDQFDVFQSDAYAPRSIRHMYIRQRRTGWK